MTKERLKELIKQNGLIFDKYGNEIDLKNTDGIYFATSQNRLFKMKEMPNIALEYWWLNEIFETEERAEWYCKTTAERTERFEPPMWEDIDDYYEFYFRNGINNIDDYWIRVKKNEYIEVVEDEYETIFDVHKNEVTKENYEKACEIVRGLFKGEK